MYDVVIIGAGVSGSSSARALSRYNLNICVVEKEEDVCCGTSKANSAIAHAGFDAKPGTLMAKLNVQGNKMMPKIAKDLDVPFNPCGSLVVCTKGDDASKLQVLYDQGIANGVEGLKILNEEEVHEMEPNLADDVVAALWAPTAGVICPFILNIAYAENACENGVEFKFDTEVEGIEKIEGGYRLSTTNGPIEAKVVVNAAGVYADKFHNMMANEKIHITPRRGDYCLLDKTAGNLVSRTIFQLPSALGKGVLVSPTVHGNIIVGPTAIDQEDKEATATTQAGINQLITQAGKSVKNIPMRQVITSFAGLRAHEDGHEFIIKELEEAPGFVDCAGIESPGLVSSPAIGEMVKDIVTGILKPTEKEDYKATRKGILDPKTLSIEERNELIKENPAYGNIICRCEKVTEGEIIDAIRRPLGAKSLDGVKRRTRAGMGRCQSGFCSPRTMEILARELGLDMSEITKCGRGSELIVGVNKEME
ncbi:NAD(P)/FAD-dependent oxidoreductase [Roseburia hominis]